MERMDRSPDRMLHEAPEEIRRRRRRKDAERPGADALDEVAEFQAGPGEGLGAPLRAPAPDLPGPGVRCPYCGTDRSRIRARYDLRLTAGVRRPLRVCRDCPRPFRSSEVTKLNSAKWAVTTNSNHKSPATPENLYKAANSMGGRVALVDTLSEPFSSIQIPCSAPALVLQDTQGRKTLLLGTGQ